ncbi:Nn.00g014980.m01.CDS01 [Neocucurbitaria sp. VM-36]
MKFSVIIAAALSAVIMASPPTMSLKRSVMNVEVNGTITPLACVECPCDPRPDRRHGFFEIEVEAPVVNY